MPRCWNNTAPRQRAWSNLHANERGQTVRFVTTIEPPVYWGISIYRLDTNYAKIDRIEHTDIEEFKYRVLNKIFNGFPIKKWASILSSNDDELLERALKNIL